MMLIYSSKVLVITMNGYRVEFMHNAKDYFVFDIWKNNVRYNPY